MIRLKTTSSDTPPEKTGLHLHGLPNESTEEFEIVPQGKMDGFAEEWGFIETISITLDGIDEGQ